MPDADAPDAVVPDAVVPDAVVPDAAVPDAAVPEGQSELAPMFATLFAGDDTEIRAYLRELGIDPEPIRLLPQWNSATGLSAVPRQRAAGLSTAEFSATGASAAERSAEQVLCAALRRSAPVPLGAAIVGLFTHFACEAEWETSYHYEPIWDTLRAMRSAWASCRALVGADDAAAMDAVCQMLVLLDQELTVESRLRVGELAPFAASARAGLDAASVLIELATRIEPANPVFARHLVEHGRTRQRYYELATHAAGAGSGFLTGQLDRAGLGRAIAGLRSVDQDAVLDANDRSEIRAHRLDLEAMHARAGDPWLRVEHGSVVYVYPFGLRGTDPLGRPGDFAVIVDRVRAEAGGWELAGIAVDHVEHDLRLSDVWAGSPLSREAAPPADDRSADDWSADAGRGPDCQDVGGQGIGDDRGTYLAGAAIVLPEVTIHDAVGTLLARLSASVVVSDLGNHHVRLAGVLAGADPQQVHFALLRAAAVHGEVRVGFEGGDRVWPQLSALVADLIGGLCERVSRDGDRLLLSAQAGRFHVVLSVHAASVATGPAGADRTLTGSASEAIAAVGGATLLNPVRNSVASVAEWARYVPDQGAVVNGVAFGTDIVARTYNTTVIVMPGTPAWQIGTYQSLAEFVVSLDGLFLSWFDELDRQLAMIRSIIRRFDLTGHPTRRDIETFAQRLRTGQMRLQSFVADARSLQLLFRSPRLVASPLGADILSKLLTAAGLERVERDFAAKVSELLDDRLAVWINDMAVRQEQRRRAALEIVLALVTAAGVSGVVQVFEGGPGAGWSVFQSGAAAVGVVVAAIVMVVIAFLVGRRPARSRTKQTRLGRTRPDGGRPAGGM